MTFQVFCHFQGPKLVHYFKMSGQHFDVAHYMKINTFSARYTQTTCIHAACKQTDAHFSGKTHTFLYMHISSNCMPCYFFTKKGETKFLIIQDCFKFYTIETVKMYTGTLQHVFTAKLQKKTFEKNAQLFINKGVNASRFRIARIIISLITSVHT